MASFVQKGLMGGEKSDLRRTQAQAAAEQIERYDSSNSLCLCQKYQEKEKKLVHTNFKEKTKRPASSPLPSHPKPDQLTVRVNSN